jgi:uncharacterized protein (UPF0264 family)
MSRTLLLVSVRCADEVATAVDGGAEIIDVKEPSHGSLGMATLETLAACAVVVPEHLLWTVAGGELVEHKLVEHNESGSAAGQGVAGQGVAGQGVAFSLHSLERLPDAIKFGLSQCEGTSWEHVFQNVAKQLPECVQAIPVAYADRQAASSPAVDTVLEAAARHGWETVLVDTFDKLQSGSLLDLVAVETIEQWVARARDLGVRIVLAGRLSLQDVPVVAACEPMAVAVRSAVCVGGRNGRVDIELVRMVASQCQSDSVKREQDRIVQNNY